MVEAALKSPLSPFSKGGIFSDATLTPLWKRGEGEILGRSEEELLCRELLAQGIDS
jgi:hypothetical protein